MQRASRRHFLKLSASAAALSLARPGISQAQSDATASLYAAAKREGSVTYYATDNPDITNRVIAEFSKRYPGIKVDAGLRLASGQMAQRFLSELAAGNYSCDVIQMADPFALGDAQKHGWLAPITDVPSAATFPKSYLSPNWALIGISPHVIAFNTQITGAAEQPHDWHALLDPKWKGQLVLSDPRNNLEVMSWLNVLNEAYGPSFLPALKAQAPHWVPSIVPGVQMMIAGNGKLVAPALHQATLLMQSKGAPVGDYTPDLTSGHETFAAVCAKGPHPNAARLLVDFLLTEAGQAAYCYATSASALPNVPGAIPLPSQFKRSQYAQIAANRTQLLAMVGL